MHVRQGLRASTQRMLDKPEKRPSPWGRAELRRWEHKALVLSAQGRGLSVAPKEGAGDIHTPTGRGQQQVAQSWEHKGTTLGPRGPAVAPLGPPGPSRTFQGIWMSVWAQWSQQRKQQ